MSDMDNTPPLKTVQVLNVRGLSKDAHEGARVLRAHVRTKTYIKDFDAALRMHPRFWPYMGMPVLAAASRLGVSPIECNEIAAVTFARCNMACWFCFAGSLLDDPTTVEEISLVSLWSELTDELVEDRRHGRPWHVIRVTGGEPLLQQDALQAFFEWRRHLEPTWGPFYLWLDTNLGVVPTDRLLKRLVEIGEPMGVVACFKGFTSADVQDNTGQMTVSLDEQFAIAQEWWRSGLDVYFYVVDSTGYAYHQPQDLAEGFIDQMRSALGPIAPLKTCPIEINEGYACQTRKKPRCLTTNVINPCWEQALRRFYSPQEIWELPHLIRRRG